MKEEHLQELAKKFDLPVETIRLVVASQFIEIKKCIESKVSIRLPYFGIFMFDENKYKSKLLNDAKEEHLNQ